MFTTTVDLKEQMAEARRTQILMGAAQVFAEKGFHKATTKEIAEAAGVAEGTIYNYFANKRELLLSMIELLAVQSLKDYMITGAPASPKEFIVMILKNRYQLVQERGQLVAPILAEMFTDAELRREAYQKLVMPVTRLMEQYIQSQIDAGLFRPVNPMIVTRAFIGVLVINFSMKLTNLDPRYEEISADALIEELTNLFLGMLLKENSQPAA